MASDAVKLDDEIVVAIPDDTVVLDNKEVGSAPAEKKEPPARVSALAKGGARDGDDERKVADRAAALERERDEARREAEEARRLAAEAAEAARIAHAGRTQAEDNARLREQQAMRAHFARLQSDKSQIEGAISATQAEEANAQAELMRAIEAGDASKQAAAQKAMAKAAAALAQLENGKYAAEQEISRAQRLFEERQEASKRTAEATPPARTPEPAAAPAPTTPEQWIDGTARQVLGDKGADWLRSNKEFAVDPKMNRKFLRFADEYAEDHGQAALKSQDFLDALNERFFPDRAEAVEEEVVEKPRAPPRATAAAPVSRSGNQFFSSRNLNASQVKLPPRLAAFVKASGLNPTEYALATVADIKAGRLPKNFLDPDYDHGV